jgi:hypothetical protein
VQRLAGQIGVDNKGYTLVGKTGTQIQFGCSRAIRHSISPDGSNMTISTKSDLLNHWIVAIKLILNRDWAWDALQTDSFLVQRTMKFKADPGPGTTENVGYIRLGNSANVTALTNPNRFQMDLLFLDAVEPKPLPGQFPDLIELEYQIIPQFLLSPQADTPLKLNLELPVTTTPAQIPVLASAGIALSKYITNADYSATEAREKYLWLEFQDPPADPNDSFFIRLLNYAPDPLLSTITPELLANTQEPALPVDPELIRFISSGNDIDDKAGLDAMQLMMKAENSDRHYIVPLPPGLHAASPELFGMFTYELRAGHNKIWSTAQGRFGRPLRATGVQHPAPTLFCSVNRDEVEISVSAPHAVSVFNGKTVTATPPRTDIWALLYAQVMQADGLSHRNILLDQRMLINMKREQVNQYKQPIRINKDATVYAINTWQNIEVEEILAIMGLPIFSSLSVVCVEMMPRPEHYVDMPREFADGLEASAAFKALDVQKMSKYMKTEKVSASDYVNTDAASEQTTESPLGKGLGQFRILRTSPLTPVPFVCCT